VLALIAERRAAGGGPGAHGDGHRLALAIEGGGMRGTVTAGMALGVHELGLTPVFDDVYGSSAGAITGAWLCSPNPPGLRIWYDTALTRTLIKRANLVRPGRPVLDVETLIEQVYPEVMDFGSVLASPLPLHVLATDAATGESVDLRPYLTSAPNLRRALRASCALPLLAGPAVELQGRRYLDSGLSESIPYQTALAQGATHVLVLSSRRAGDVARSSWSRFSRLVSATVLRRYPAELRAAFLSRTSRLSADDALLRDGHPAVFPIRPGPDSPRTGGMASDGDLLLAAFEAGRAAVYEAFGDLAVGRPVRNLLPNAGWRLLPSAGARPFRDRCGWCPAEW
jgi:predicted patatin/cPLA2 family phospholipase